MATPRSPNILTALRRSKLFGALLLGSFLLSSCYATVPRDPAAIPMAEVESVQGVILTDGSRVDFPTEAERRWEDGELVVTVVGPTRFSPDGRMLPRERSVDRYEAEEIDRLLQNEFRPFRTVGALTVGTALGLGVLFGLACLDGCFD